MKNILVIQIESHFSTLLEQLLANWPEIRLWRRLVYRPTYILCVVTKDLAIYQRFLGKLHHALHIPFQLL